MNTTSSVSEKEPVPQSMRTRCEVYTRVMGYYRPVSQFNNGKKSEFYSRKHFDEVRSANSRFVEEYSTGGKIQYVSALK